MEHFQTWFAQNRAICLDWWHALHAMPETGFAEHRTAAFIASVLRELGLEVTTGIGGTGLVGLLRGQQAGSGSPMIGIRAELDALPMTGRRGLPVVSDHPGRFHGCGHDGHMTAALTTAAYLVAHGDFAGSVAFVFQPAEELLTGARAMLDDGLLDRFPLSQIYALHNLPGLPQRHAGVVAGAALASSDAVSVTISAQGTHGAVPHTGQDGIQAAANFLVLIQQLLTRRLDSRDSAVLSFGRISGGEAGNVLPAETVIEGSIRSHSDAARTSIHDLLSQTARSIETAFGVRIDLRITPHVPALENHPDAVAVLRDSIIRALGADRLIDAPRPVMASEDFALFLRQVPGAFVFIGQDGPFCHHPDYAFDPSVIETGGAIFSDLILNQLAPVPHPG